MSGDVVDMRPRILAGFMREALAQLEDGALEGAALVILPRDEVQALHVHMLPDDAVRRRIFRDGMMELLTAAHGSGRRPEAGGDGDGQD